MTGLLLQPRRSPDDPPSWRNLSRAGRLVLVLLVVVTVAKIVKSQGEAISQRQASEASAKKLTELQATNQRLIKVMSVSGGYSALLSGVVVFEQPPDQQRVEEALRNLFLKYAEVDIEASNQFGTYQGRVDYGAHPEVRRYLSFERIHDDPDLVRYRDQVPRQRWPQAFFYEIRCANLKILNDDKIEYVRFDPQEEIRVQARVFDWWRDFRSLYGVQSLYIDSLTIEELGKIPIDRTF